MQSKDSIRLVLPLQFDHPEWGGNITHEESRLLTFWDTFEWGLWLVGRLLYSCEGVYHLCTHEGGWIGEELSRESSAARRQFWGDFTTPAMRGALEEPLGLRGLAPVVEGIFHRSQGELRNKMGKIVCRVEWTAVAPCKQRGDILFQACRITPLLGYESEATRLVEKLSLAGAKPVGDGPLGALLGNSNLSPHRYTLRPEFGLRQETPAREAMGVIVRSMLTLALSNVPGIIRDLDTEFLHDYRICFRKIRSGLSLIKEVYPPHETLRLREIFGDLARQTNRLRDLDVYLLARDEYLGMLPPGFRQGMEGMFKDFAAERGTEVRRVTSKLRGAPWRRLHQEVAEYFAPESVHGPSPAADLPIGPLAFRRIHKRYQLIRKLAAEIGAETPDEAVHQLRIQCKKLRYLMEFFAELIPPEEGAILLKLLRRLQGKLGEFNDASVQQHSLLSYWAGKKSGCEAALGLGGLVSLLYHKQQQSRLLIHQAMDGFCDGATAATFKRIFKQPVAVHPTAATRSEQP